MTLVEELRECVGKYRAGVGEVCSRAADRIEELEKRVAVLENDRGFERDGFVKKQAASGLQPPSVDPLPSVTPESQNRSWMEKHRWDHPIEDDDL